MKLSDHTQKISRAYGALLHEYSIVVEQPPTAFGYTHRHPNHVLPREKPHPLLTSLAVTYPPSATFTHVQNQECFILAAAFQATFQDAPHPITPDQVPIIIDSGASITISPCHLDFMNGIKPVQPA
jgi:hypothetical protein